MSSIIIASSFVLLFNYAIFTLAYKQQTDHYTDITYAFSFVLVAAYLFISGQDFSLPKTFLLVMIVLWGLRLGIFLRARVKKMGNDGRFTEIRPYFIKFFKFFTLQGTAICLISLPFMIGFQKNLYVNGFNIPFFWIGSVMMVSGLLVESISDYQKNSFKSKPDNSSLFFSKGLFTHIRHPNYLGEIMFWTGIFIYVHPYLSGFEHASIISPISITFLLIKVTGIKLLEEKAQLKYGDMPEYHDYINQTWRLIPFLY